MGGHARWISGSRQGDGFGSRRRASFVGGFVKRTSRRPGSREAFGIAALNERLMSDEWFFTECRFSTQVSGTGNLVSLRKDSVSGGS